MVQMSPYGKMSFSGGGAPQREGVVALDDELGIYSGVTVSQSNNALIIGG